MTPHVTPQSAAKIFAIIPAGGSGSRVGADCPKQYLPLVEGRSMLEYTARVLLEQAWIEQVVVVVAPDDHGYSESLASLVRDFGPRVSCLRKGGSTRRDTVLAGLDYLSLQQLSWQARQSSELAVPLEKTAWVMVHDAARPGVDVASLLRLRDAVLSDTQSQGGLLALPIADTIKKSIQLSAASEIPRSTETLDRSLLWAAQTPQMFPLLALQRALKQTEHVTDEASAMERTGGRPLLVRGNSGNFKVTTFDDLVMMRSLLSSLKMTMHEPKPSS